MILERRVVCASAGVFLFLLLVWVVRYCVPTINDQLQRYHALPRAQQRGVATGMFRHIEDKLGRTLVPGKKQTPDGRALWAGSRGRFGVLDKR